MGCITVASKEGKVTSNKHKYWILVYDTMYSELVTIINKSIKCPQFSQENLSEERKSKAVKATRDLLALWEENKGFPKGRAPEIRVAEEISINSKRVPITRTPYTPTTPDAITQLNKKEKKKASNELNQGQVGSKIVIENSLARTYLLRYPQQGYLRRKHHSRIRIQNRRHFIEESYVRNYIS